MTYVTSSLHDLNASRRHIPVWPVAGRGARSRTCFLQSYSVGPPADRFATIQHAVYIASTYNLNGWNLTINVANGRYTGPVSLPQTNGSGTITLTGNTANPSLCQVTTTTPYGTCISVQGAGTYYVGGFRCATGPGCYYGIEAQAGYMIVNGSMQFGPCTVGHIVASHGALVWLDSPSRSPSRLAPTPTNICGQPRQGRS